LEPVAQNFTDFAKANREIECQKGTLLRLIALSLLATAWLSYH